MLVVGCARLNTCSLSSDRNTQHAHTQPPSGLLLLFSHTDLATCVCFLTLSPSPPPPSHPPHPHRSSPPLPPPPPSHSHSHSHSHSQPNPTQHPDHRPTRTYPSHREVFFSFQSVSLIFEFMLVKFYKKTSGTRAQVQTRRGRRGGHERRHRELMASELRSETPVHRCRPDLWG